MSIESTTAEIVYDLRYYADVFSRFNPEDSGYKAMEQGLLLAADRLESQEQTIAALTVRAEQAEKERELAVKALSDYEDALFEDCDKSYQSGFMDGFRSREEIDDED